MVSVESKSVRELAVEVQGAAKVFEKFGIDYCCGGNLTLKEACRRSGANLEEVTSCIRNVHSEASPVRNWSKESLGKLIHHIVEKHHAFTREEAARLEKLFAKVCAVHASRHPELEEMQTIFREMALELRTHMMKEEHILFPYLETMEEAVLKKRPIPRPMFGSVEFPVRNMMKEHDAAGEGLKALRRASHNYTTPPDACTSYRELYKSLKAFEGDLHTHVHLENNILFPRALEIEAANS